MISILSFFLSFLIVAFGQPAWVPEAGLLAAAGGYALFWKSMLGWPKPLSRFLLAGIWFIGVQAVQLSWMTSIDYMGPLMLGVYAGLLLGLALQFALLSSFLDPKKALSFFHCIALAGAGVLLEWIRLYFLTGFTWNPAGLAMTGNLYPLQLASAIGIYGLTFWVFWTNFGALAFLMKPNVKKAALWAFLSLFPYGYGFVYQIVAKSQAKTHITAAVIDTGLKVEEKYRDKRDLNAFIPPLIQWEKVWSYLKKPAQLIVLPEAAFPYSTNQPICLLEIAEARWKIHFGEESLCDFPQLKPPFAFQYEWEGRNRWMVTNSFLAQALANHFQADLITGLDYEEGEAKRTNAAFLFRPGKESPERYDKRILVPVGEYVPLQNVKWISEFLSREFGIRDSFDAGKEAKIFDAVIPIGVPICLEEIYAELVRDLRNRGAELFVSLSNDVWFPNSRLANQHLDHARVRAVENGVSLIRSSNMGWTGGIDCFGQSIALQTPGTQGAVYFSIPNFSVRTLYSFWGDAPVFCISCLFFSIYLLNRWRRKSCP